MTRLTLTFVAMLSLLGARSVCAQTIEDGYMLSAHELRTGLVHSRDFWDQYWEGTRERRNGNIGKITTDITTWSANYGFTDRLNVLASVPYVSTRASQGVLTGMEGFQDLTLAAKYRVAQVPFAKIGDLGVMAVISGAIPLSDYSPDFQPLSIGTASKRIAGRLSLHLATERGYFLDGTAAYTWRDNVTLDRSSYFTNGHLFLTNEVEMPSVFDYAFGGGFARGGFMGSLSLKEQRTRGGGDIRRQDMPFVSNRMDFTKAGLMMQYMLPAFTGFELEFEYAYTLHGRNVGKAATATAGFAYRFDFDRRRRQ